MLGIKPRAWCMLSIALPLSCTPSLSAYRCASTNWEDFTLWGNILLLIFSIIVNNYSNQSFIIRKAKKNVLTEKYKHVKIKERYSCIKTSSLLNILFSFDFQNLHYFNWFLIFLYIQSSLHHPLLPFWTNLILPPMVCYCYSFNILPDSISWCFIELSLHLYL